MIIQRRLFNLLQKAFNSFKIVYISGARQVGKTTLLKVFAKNYGKEFITFDDPKIRTIASDNPEIFIQTTDTPAFFDEIQKVPEIIDYMKIAVDNSDKNGQYVITGSTNIFHNPKIYESLAGRMAILELLPFSSSELRNRKFNLVEKLFDPKFYLDIIKEPVLSALEIPKKLVQGMFPAIVTGKVTETDLWFKSYIFSRLHKDLTDLTEKKLHKLESLEKMITLLAARTASLLNFSSLAQDLKIRYETVKNYFRYLEALYLVYRLQPFFKNIGKQVLKTPKLYFIDTGLIAHLLNLHSTGFDFTHDRFGYLLENHVFLELKKEILLLNGYKIFFYRDNHKNEVEFILENPKQKIVAIEVKGKTNIKDTDLRGLKALNNTIGNQIVNMIIFYLGDKLSARKLGDRTVFLVPVGILF